ncbi:hypothetical protein [Terribacillus saccharophilus]|uniref:hypothetical protein n=1 Tax=Terribacillus saccharophilus TaxID=361277 RepID=UPI000BA5D4A9|nr:hypothetical protein [Terribacillus saccharophilus]PAF18622.1 hypothetical protein CHH51_06905 [Terribacillus saccharophilus]
MKEAHLYGAETKRYLYDWITVYPDEHGNYELPENSTWERPIREDGSAFILPVFVDGEWQEGGVAPEPTPPQPSDEDLLGQALAEEKMKSLELQQSTDELGRQLAEEKLKNLAKDEILQQQELSIQAIGQELTLMKYDKLISEGSK